MSVRFRYVFVVGGIFLLAGSFLLFATDNPAPGPGSDPAYQQLRNLTLSGESVGVSGFDLKRDAGTFHLHSGTVCFAPPVQGKVTGAVFTGDGNFVLDAPTESERKSLKLLTKENEFSENFSQMVLRFTDSTYEELKKAGTATAGGCDAGLLKDSQNATRHKLKTNLEARILEDLLSPAAGGLFVAFIHGKRYNDKELFVVDPHGVHVGWPVAPEEVELMTYDENKYGCWAAFHLSQEYKNGTATGNQRNWLIAIEHEQLDTEIEKSGNLIGKAATTFSAVANGVRVVKLDLFHTLRVESVTGDGGQPLAFIQEDKNDDAQFFVILPKPLATAEKYTITTRYAGKDAVSNEGGDNYYPIARTNWYPNSGDSAFGNYATYDMTFHIPKGMKIAATGVPTENNEKEGISHWVSAAPQVVAGFNFGRFKMEEIKLTKPEYLVQSYANMALPDWADRVQHLASGADLPTMSGSHISKEDVALGSMSTTVLNKKALREAQLAVQVYSDYFGTPPFKQLQVTQQTADNYGQAWPGLVYLPITYFFDTTTRHGLITILRNRCPSCFAHGDDPYGYFKVVAPHEVAHQWWGHTVSWGSYRDQWMSEGFADASASIYLQAVYSKEPQQFASFWHDELEMLTERNKEGFRAIDVGPVTMGRRLNSSRAGFDIYRDLIYPKGAFILHMIRMMMWDRRNGDQNFKATMQDFVATYSGKTATTEDFKAMVEKHMTEEMDIEGNHRMDWFFNEYVYGTAVPSYHLSSNFDKDANGDIVLGFKLTQSGVDDSFRMLVPIYVELADGRTVMLGRARLVGNASVEQRVPLRGLKDAPKRALVNYNYDVLAIGPG